MKCSKKKDFNLFLMVRVDKSIGNEFHNLHIRLWCYLLVKDDCVMPINLSPVDLVKLLENIYKGVNDKTIEVGFLVLLIKTDIL